MTAEVVIESLGHIGASTKSEGEAIGHKGIGFKSVLEASLSPEIYSGLQEAQPGLAVRFDPELAYSTIVEASPTWASMLSTVQGIDPEDELAAVPILRFPLWVDELPTAVAELAADGFDTVVRLPFDERFAGRLNLGNAAWLDTVRRALEDISDEILLLLGCFSEVRVDDVLLGRRESIVPEWEAPAEVRGADGTREVVRILRNGELSSRWRLFRRSLPELEDLAGEIAVGLRLGDSSERASVLPAVRDDPSAPFHLFFPTRIASGLPFLLHGYFEVDAGRTGFYRGSAGRNVAILGELARLTARAVQDAAKGETDLVSLVDLIAAAGEPEEPLARSFRTDVLRHLDAIEWVPCMPRDSHASPPHRLFVTRPDLIRLVADVFPATYVKRRVGLDLPDSRLTDEALELIASRQTMEGADRWETLSSLCRPGETAIWEGSDADRGFLRLLDLLAALEVDDRSAATALIDGLRGDPDSRLLPTAGEEGTRLMLPVPDPSEGAPGRRSQLLMARARVAGEPGETLRPPAELDLAFLPEGLLASEADIDRAKPLGVRRFTVDNVLDRLNGIADAEIDRQALLRFLWRLLHRERVSGFGTRRSAERAATFDPNEWFWCRPGRAREDENVRFRQQRERYLAMVPLPSRHGSWRSAGELTFGADWAEWLDAGFLGAPTAAISRRASAYRALEKIAPGAEKLVAAPEVLLQHLEAGTLGGSPDEEGAAEEQLDEHQRNSERHSFLLRLGVWEVVPVEAFESRDPRDRENFPWTGAIAERQRALIEQAGGWTFDLVGWAGQRHANAYLAEDYRFSWSLEEMAERDPLALAESLQLGAKLYSERESALFFCPRCRDSGGGHSTTRFSAGAGYPSSLSLQLRFDPWATCTLDGNALESPQAPSVVWWHQRPPSGAGLRQSPLRLLPLCSPSTGMSEELRRLARVKTLEDADLDALGSLLLDLRERFERLTLPVDPSSPGTARQAFVGLHRLVYLRLAELAGEDGDAVTSLLAETGVLCELGEGLVHRNPAEAHHDDGRFASYVRYFAGEVPLVILPSDWKVTAAAIGVKPFEVQLSRRTADDGRDVTDELRDILGDRIAEFLSIVVHHSLGTQTLEPMSQQFEERARRLQALSVRQLDDLVIDASIPGSALGVTLGEGSDQDLFLEGPTSSSPVLFHDINGEGWQDRVRRKVASHIALVLENAAYAATFALFLQAESDAEREEFLLDLGVSTEDVEGIATRIGAADEEERRRYLRWYGAILDAQGVPAHNLDLDAVVLVPALSAAGFVEEVAHQLVEAGGGERVRSDTGEDSPLRLLAASGVDLTVLDENLRKVGDSGLTILVARRILGRWLDQHGRRCAVVLATRQSPEAAKSSIGALEPPSHLAFSLDPSLDEVLEPVASLLQAVHLEFQLSGLVEEPTEELARAGGFESPEALDAQILMLFDEEEQKRVLREHAALWRREIRLLAVLARMGASETRATIRAMDEAVSGRLPTNPARPSEMVDVLTELFAEQDELADELGSRIVDSVTSAVPERDELLALAAANGLRVDRLAIVERALEAPRREQAREIRRRTERLAERGVVPVPPPGLQPLTKKPQKDSGGIKRVAVVKVEASHDRRKRELGDEGERWALAAIVGSLLEASPDIRDEALDQIIELLGRFEGAPVEAARSHAELARSRDLDDEEIIDELAGLLHVSRHSDAFGFDLLGWLPPSDGTDPQAICLEVKSSSGEGFHLSKGEWAVAQRLHDAEAGDQYAVLVVRRGKRGGVPTSMDLLVDPVALVESGQLLQEVDGYQIAYRSLPDS